ncbi:MAG: hypothetical protein R3A11_07630 [Bdellovibrionota bacterium]
MKLYRSHPGSTEMKLSPGHLHMKNERLMVGCQDGVLEIIELQREGKSKQTPKELIPFFQSKGIEQWK